MEKNISYEEYPNGVTVVASSDSPTGYLAVFVFDEAGITEEYLDYYRKQYQADLCERLDLNRISRVQIYSNTALLFCYDEQKKHEILDPVRTAHAPEEFRDGMYPAGGDTTVELYGGKKVNYDRDMTEFAPGKWGTAIPLLSGCTDYNVRLIDEEGRTDGTYLFDPANRPMQNPISGLYSRSSVVYVPYDEKKQPAYCNRDIENPRTDGKTGTLEFTEYDGADGSKRHLAVYLPAGYDPEREELYRVIYISHGMQAEKRGCEMRWLHECAVRNMLDHLEKDFVLVAMNNSDFDWDYEKIWAEQERIFIHIEKKYHVSSVPEDRAYVGFSMGGMTTSYMYMKHTDSFGYFGIWNAAAHQILEALPKEEKETLAKKNVKVQIAYGDWDWCMPTLDSFSAQLKELGIAHDFFTVPGSHDWRCFALIFARSVQSFLFQ